MIIGSWEMWHHFFLLMDDVGFSHLVSSLEPQYVMPSRRYMTETIMLKLHENWKKVNLKVCHISGSQVISGTRP